MMILVGFLLIIVVGLAVFFRLLLSEGKLGRAPGASHERPGPASVTATIQGALRVPATLATSLSQYDAHNHIESGLLDKLDEKCLKLEQMLEEKNRSLARLQEELNNEHGHRREFESLKDILQQQIEELKAQNRKLKEDVARLSQNTLEMAAQEAPSEVLVGADVVMASDPVASVAAAPLKLTDIFDPEVRK